MAADHFTPETISNCKPPLPSYEEPSYGAQSPSKILSAIDTLPSFRRSCTESLLLQQPLEIRHAIYKYVLGDRLIHIRCVYPISTACRHVVCQHDHVTRSAHLWDPEGVGGVSSDAWEWPHRFCHWDTYYDPDIETSSDYWDHERMHLTILRCCRQTYAEANPILWSTNTFAFHEHKSLKEFMEDRNESQKRCMRALHLRFDLKLNLLSARRRLLTPGFMGSLSGLRTMTLILEEQLDPRVAQSMVMTGKSLSELGGNRIDAGIENLALLPLRRVVVEVRTPRLNSGKDHPLLEKWKSEYAEKIRTYLLGRQLQTEADC